MRRGKIDALLGLQRGDEGKGKLAYYYAVHYYAGLRYNGGANAGHEIMVNGQEITLHQFPVSVLLGRLSLIGNASLFDPILWQQEKNELSESPLAIDINTDNFAVGENSYVVMPHHKLLDALTEKS